MYGVEGARWDDMKVAHNATSLPDKPQTSDFALGLRLETKPTVPLTGTLVQLTLQKSSLHFIEPKF